MSKQHIRILDQQQFGASTTDFGDDGPRVGQFRIELQQGLNSEIRNAVDFRLVNRDDLNTCRRIDPVEK